MDEEKRIEQQKRLNDLLEKGIGLSSAYNDTIKELLGVQSKRSTFDSNLLKINRQINTAIYNTKTEFDNIGQISREIAKNQNILNRAQAINNNLAQSISEKSKERADNLYKEFEILRSNVAEQEELLQNAAKTGELDSKRLENLEKEIKQQQEKIDNSEDILNLSEKQYLFSKLNAEELERQNKSLKEQGNSLKSLGVISELFSKIPGAGEASKEAFKEVSASIAAGTLNAKGLSGAFRVTGAFIKAFAKSLYVALGPITLIVGAITELIKGLGRADEQVTDIAKSMATSKTEAALFRAELADAATNSGDIFVTGTKLVKTFTDLNKQFGFITNFSAETLVSVTQLTEKVGLAADVAGNLAAASLLNGKSLDDNFKSVLSTSYELQRQTGIQLDLREITDAVGKTTGQIRANLGANPSLIAKAVTQAKLLGGELDDIKTISAALLDFESSISNELQAELLTGKALNLERARFAALNGDVATVAKEINNQVGNFGEFTKLNVIQQDALAASLGLTSDRLSDILFKQGIQNRSVRELRAAGEDDLANKLQQTNVQQKLNAAIDKMKDLFTDVGIALLPVAQVLGGILGIVGTIAGFIRDIIRVVGVLFGFDFGKSGTLKGIQSILNSFGGEFTFGDYNFSDDALIPGYGKRMLMEEGKITAFNDNDNIVATTNEIKPISSVQPQVQAAPQVNIDTDSLKEQMKMQTKVLERILNKEGQVSIDSSKAGRAFTVGTYRIQ